MPMQAAELIADDDEKFKAWRDKPQNREGFVINANRKPRIGYLQLHRAGCATFKPPYTTTAYAKIVAPTVADLEDWVQSQFGTDARISQRRCKCLRQPIVRRQPTLLDHSGWESQSGAELPGMLDLETGDERELAMLAVRLRRGQSAFRNLLIKTYGPACMMTGCDVLAVIEAAHIKCFRGLKDHQAGNGLLLRADIHTLYDLNLLAIEPSSLRIKIHRCLKETLYGELDGRPLLFPEGCQLSREALTVRWSDFNDG